MTGIIKTDQLQGAQGTTVTVTSGHDLTVGTTNNNPTSSGVNVAGQSFTTTGGVRSTVDQNPAATFNRKTSDGEIALFRKDGTTIGRIGTNGDLYIAGTTHGIKFDSIDSTTMYLRPTNASGTNVTGQIDLGQAGNVFRDAYVSGGVYFAPNAYPANYLDDYEEGTFLPRYGGTSNNGTVYYTHMNGVYTKIGRMVRVWIDISISSASGMSGTPIIYNLPFASANDLGTEAASGNAPINATTRYDMGQSVWWDIDTNFTGSRPATGWFTNNVSYFLLYTHNANYNAGHSQMQLNQTGRIACSLTYTTAS